MNNRSVKITTKLAQVSHSSLHIRAPQNEEGQADLNPNPNRSMLDGNVG